MGVKLTNATYISEMEHKLFVGLDNLHEGVTELRFSDFPDYPNVGDSAIALGQMRYWRSRQIKILSISSVHSLHRGLATSTDPVVINGGGNLGGLYEHHENHRMWLSESLPESTLLIQLPQSVHFVDDACEERYRTRFASRRNTRLAVRDHESLALARRYSEAHLVPDSVHALGRIESPQPTARTILLARTDGESSASALTEGSVDWLEDRSFFLRHELRGWRRIVSRRQASWRRRAQTRLRYGVSLLSGGETIVTDRLHAMLIGLQMGRRVVAVDNNNNKLTRYAETWFGELQPDLRWATDISDAMRIARSSGN